MIEWINSKEQPFPRDGNTYLGLFKGQFCLWCLDPEEKMFYLMWMPGTYDKAWEVSEDELDGEYHTKLSHWAILKRPEDY